MKLKELPSLKHLLAVNQNTASHYKDSMFHFTVFDKINFVFWEKNNSLCPLFKHEP
jgi:hypothetical protein